MQQKADQVTDEVCFWTHESLCVIETLRNAYSVTDVDGCLMGPNVWIGAYTVEGGLIMVNVHMMTATLFF